jgi:hypothetical protein
MFPRNACLPTMRGGRNMLVAPICNPGQILHPLAFRADFLHRALTCAGRNLRILHTQAACSAGTVTSASSNMRLTSPFACTLLDCVTHTRWQYCARRSLHHLSVQQASRERPAPWAAIPPRQPQTFQAAGCSARGCLWARHMPCGGSSIARGCTAGTSRGPRRCRRGMRTQTPAHGRSSTERMLA